jgi:hypothetical protein
MSEQTRLMIDGHVHVYDCYDLGLFFKTANAYLDYYYGSLYANGIPHAKLLLLTEAKTNDFFSKWQQDGAFENEAGYTFVPTEEESLRLEKEGKLQCFLVRGRQVITRENLEILAIGSGPDVKDGLPARDVIDTLVERKQPAVLAWGVGKWLFKRGNVIKDLIESYRTPYLFAGDNSGRPTFWPTPSRFKQAQALHMAMLNGSDPLPFDSEVHKPGSFGSTLEGSFDPARPFHSLRELLTTPNIHERIESFGRRDNIVSFFKRQSKIYLKKYLKK